MTTGSLRSLGRVAKILASVRRYSATVLDHCDTVISPWILCGSFQWDFSRISVDFQNNRLKSIICAESMKFQPRKAISF